MTVSTYNDTERCVNRGQTRIPNQTHEGKRRHLCSTRPCCFPRLHCSLVLNPQIYHQSSEHTLKTVACTFV